MEDDLCLIREMSQKKEKENQDFRLFLKGYDHYKVDEMVHELSQKYLSQYDCRECGNCCEKLTPTLTHEEIKNISKYLDISNEKFKTDYIKREIAEGFILKGSVCPFQKNKECSIYEVRPEVCRSFPHLHKDNINHRLLSIIENSYICPIIYNVIENLKIKLRNK